MIDVQQALIHAHSCHTGHLPGHKAVKDSTYGILFLGTPHRGSYGANMHTLLLNIWSLARPTKTDIVQDLRSDSEALERQLDQYLPISTQFDTKFFYEAYPTKLAPGIELLVYFAHIDRLKPSHVLRRSFQNRLLFLTQ